MRSGAWSPRCEDISKRRCKIIWQTRFHQERRAPFLLGSRTHASLALAGHNHDWNLPCPGVTVEVLNELPSGVHRDLRRDDVRMRDPRSRVSVRNVIDGVGLKPEGRERLSVQFTRVGIAIHDENQRVFRWSP